MTILAGWRPTPKFKDQIRNLHEKFSSKYVCFNSLSILDRSLKNTFNDNKLYKFINTSSLDVNLRNIKNGFLDLFKDTIGEKSEGDRRESTNRFGISTEIGFGRFIHFSEKQQRSTFVAQCYGFQYLIVGVRKRERRQPGHCSPVYFGKKYIILLKTLHFPVFFPPPSMKKRVH